MKPLLQPEGEAPPVLVPSMPLRPSATSLLASALAPNPSDLSGSNRKEKKLAANLPETLPCHAWVRR